jgi:hypothetical protein
VLHIKYINYEYFSIYLSWLTQITENMVILIFRSQTIAERWWHRLEHEDSRPSQLSNNMDDTFLHHPWDECTIKGKCIPVGSVDFLDFLVLLKTLDFFSSVLHFQGLGMIAKHVASCLAWKPLAHINVYLAEALLDTGFEGLSRPSFLEWQFSKYSFCCAPSSIGYLR